MKKILCLLAIVALLLVACNNGDVSEPTEIEPKIAPRQIINTEQTQEQEQVKTETKTTEPVEKSDALKLSSDVEEMIVSDMKVPTRLVVKPATITAKVGDSVVYGLGLNNIYNEPRDFRIISINFKEAKDTFNNAIKTDEAIEKWNLDKYYEDIALEGYSYSIVPLRFKVQDTTASGKETVPGTYRFEAVVYIFNDPEKELKDKYATKEFFIRVE